ERSRPRCRRGRLPPGLVVRLIATKTPPDHSGGVSFCSPLLRGGSYLQWPVLIVFWVQFATEFTSAAAPRTVLQPAIVNALPIRTTVTSFRTMIAPPFCVRNEHDRSYGCLSSSLTGRLAVHRILRAVR